MDDFEAAADKFKIDVFMIAADIFTIIVSNLEKFKEHFDTTQNEQANHGLKS